MGMNLETLIEPCIGFKDIYEDSYTSTYGCENCNTSNNNDEQFCKKCGAKLCKYKKQSEYLIDIWEITDDEMYDVSINDITYCFSNVKIDGLCELSEDEPFVFDIDSVSKQIELFKKVHSDNIEKLKKVAPDLEIVFVALQRWT